MSAVMDAVGLAPPSRLRLEDHLPLGAPVRWTHRAAVARWRWVGTRGQERYGEWHLTEGCEKGWVPPISRGVEDDSVYRFTLDDPFYERRRGRNNKTVIVWPDEGEGFLFGLIRRGIGESVPQRPRSGSMFGDDDGELGYFVASGYVSLYALKMRLEGVSYLLAPWWAVQAVGTAGEAS